MSTFETYPKTLRDELVNLIHTREMGLPDFQRDFVWQPGQTQALIISLARSFPAGSLLRIWCCPCWPMRVGGHSGTGVVKWLGSSVTDYLEWQSIAELSVGVHRRLFRPLGAIQPGP